MLISQDYAKRLAGLLVEGKLVLFVGAGISLQAKPRKIKSGRLPLWAELAQRVAKKRGEKLDDYNGDILDLFDSVELKSTRLKLEDAVRAAIPEDEFAPGPVHDLIAELPWRMIYTTNYDNLLSRALNENSPVVTEQDYEYFNRADKEQPRLVHLHGTMQNMHTLTGADYNNWSIEHPKAHNRLVVDGTENAFLFLGYSNSDPHFRHMILPLIKKLKTSRGHNNYSWMWRPSDDQVDLFWDRDGLEVHRIEEDNEWEACLDCLKSAWLELPRPKAKPLSGRGGANPLSLATTERQITINGYKLFYYRDFGNISRDTLSKHTGIPSRRIRYLEGVNKNKDLGPECFKSCSVAELQGLEKALGPDISLEYGKTDDFLAYYIEYYKNNWKTPRAKTAPQQDQDSIFQGRTRAVVFDFGGTLTIPQFKESTWERIWKSVEYTLEEANELHHRFSAGKINHQEWCDLTCRKLRDAGFSTSHFERVYSDIKPIDGLKETFEDLRTRRIAIHIVSGSLRTIIEKVLDDSARHVDSIRSNDMEFDSTGLLKKITGHPYDFEGKASFIQLVAKELNCPPINILFVGNSLNDEKAATSGARTLCVNPKHTHFYVQSMWNHTIRDMKNLKQILEYV